MAHPLVRIMTAPTQIQLTPRHDRLLKYLTIAPDLTVLRLARVFLWSDDEIRRLLVDLEMAGRVTRDKQAVPRWRAVR